MTRNTTVPNRRPRMPALPPGCINRIAKEIGNPADPSVFIKAIRGREDAASQGSNDRDGSDTSDDPDDSDATVRPEDCRNSPDPGDAALD